MRKLCVFLFVVLSILEIYAESLTLKVMDVHTKAEKQLQFEEADRTK